MRKNKQRGEGTYITCGEICVTKRPKKKKRKEEEGQEKKILSEGRGV